MSALHYMFILNVKCIIVECVLVIVVAYLVLFHPLIIMMCWSYWKTIFTPAATSPKQVESIE